MKSSFYGHCEKHNSDLTSRASEHGKTIDVCEECEQEKYDLFRDVFLEDTTWKNQRTIKDR
jgi:hypothetical protein